MPDFTWEEAVQWLREQPGQEFLVAACYFDDPLLEAAERFAKSEEWRASAQLMPEQPGRALDLGAGRGIASYALARDGWTVTALEADPSSLVGAGAIRQLSADSGLKIDVVEERFEDLPFQDETFDMVYARQALHHARRLTDLCNEVFRVLKPGGRFIAVREHVISRPEDLQDFLKTHPLHHLYGGEHAYLLDEYMAAMRGAGLEIKQVWGPFDSVINYFPAKRKDLVALLRSRMEPRIGSMAARLLVRDWYPFGSCLVNAGLARLGRRDQTPGRLFSFVSVRPA